VLYPRFWWTCAIFAAVVLVIFVLLFRNDSKDVVPVARGLAVEPAAPNAPVA